MCEEESPCPPLAPQTKPRQQAACLLDRGHWEDGVWEDNVKASTLIGQIRPYLKSDVCSSSAVSFFSPVVLARDI